jgi:AMP deaminase
MMQRSAIAPSFPPHHIVHDEESDDSEAGDLALDSAAEQSDVDEHEGDDGFGDDTEHVPTDLAQSVHSEQHGRSQAGEHEPQGMLARDRQRRTTFYSYQHEKQMSHVEAKQFYQPRRQNTIDGQSTSATPLTSRSPVINPRTFPHLGGDQHTLGYSGSVRSHHSSKPPAYHSALPVGLADPNKAPDHPSVQTPNLGRFEGVNGAGSASHMGHSAHQPNVLHENSTVADPTLDTNPAHPSSVTTELNQIYSNIQKVLDIRHKYIRLSLQGPTDNPRDDPGWNIYPPPPEPVWQNNKERVEPSQESDQNGTRSPLVTPADNAAAGTHRPPRKMGTDIGEDFFYEECFPLPEPSEMTFQLDSKGVFQVYETKQSVEMGEPIIHIPDIREFYMDLDTVLGISSDGPSKSFAFRRLQYLEGKFNLYNLLNEYQEIADTKAVPHRDFYNVRKVDTHVHHSACMNQKHLLRFIKSKMKKSPDEVVLFRDGKYLTLKEVFESLKLTAYDLSIDTLDMHAHVDSFHRFDKFNLKYNPVGESRLRTIFLKTDNHIQGRYLAEITKEVISDLESSKYQMVEWRISIYGRSLDEWDKLAAWVVDNKLYSPNVRWLIQVPRLFDVYKASGLMEKYEEVVKNVFQPLFEVTQNPNSHPKLHIFLQRVIGFDSVDDESKAERRIYRKFPLPKDWSTAQNPPYSYWIYYLFANIASLNVWRKQRGFNTFVLRPHCGEAGDTDHLGAAVLCCHSISHGLLLRKVPLLQYIFYLERIGVAMSPLSNNALFLAYERNPFLQYFRRGLNVSLSTDDPLQFAFTKEPLIEEYAVAAQIYKLSAVDMCELAKNSVLQSGFEHAMKQRWLGKNFHLPGTAGNDMAKVNVPNIREAYRHETWLQEIAMIDRYTNAPAGNRISASKLAPDVTTAKQGGPPHSPTVSMMTNPSATNNLTSDVPIRTRPAGQHSLKDDNLSLPHAYLPNAQAARNASGNSGLALNVEVPHDTISTTTTSNDPAAHRPSKLRDATAGADIHNNTIHSPTTLPEAGTTSPTGSGMHHSLASLGFEGGAEPKIFPGVVSRQRKASVTDLEGKE